MTGSLAIVGGLMGLPAGGVGALPGAALGAKVGFFAAFPIQLAADFLWRSYDRDFDTRQRQAVTAALYRHYDLAPL